MRLNATLSELTGNDLVPGEWAYDVTIMASFSAARSS